MKIDKYISELLFQYDCVIVPDLGGFIANYKPATIQPIQNTFNPPSKGISFNKNLSNNDGLLANHIVQVEQINYTDACKRIEEYVTNVNLDLKLKKKAILSEIGELFLDVENRLQFQPAISTNYLLDSYGLTSFQKFPIKRISIEERVSKEFKDRTAQVAIVGEPKKSKKWLVAAAITIPLVAFALWVPTQVDLSADLNYANLNPFTPDVKSVYKKSLEKTDFIPVRENDVKGKINSASADVNFLEVVFSENEKPLLVKLNEKPISTATDSTYVATQEIKLNYHIIGGCFSEKKNAKKMVRSLKRKGFTAWIIGKRKGLWAVSYTSFSTRKEAVDMLAVAQEHNSKAWILHQ